MNQHCCVASDRIVPTVAARFCGEYVEVVVVVAGDGEVPHPPVVVGRNRAAVGHDLLTVGRLEVLALAELGGLDPLPAGRVPEEVAGGGVDDLDAVRGFDVEVIQVGVVVRRRW